MLQIENHIGKITVSKSYLTTLCEQTVENCFGVSGLKGASVLGEWLNSVRGKQQRGVSLRTHNNKLIVNIHIAVSYGINISAVVDSITNKVRYAVNQATGLDIAKVNVYIDDLYE